MPATPPPVTGLVARYFGSPGGATNRFYWVQAIYADGSRSVFAGPLQVSNTPAALGGSGAPTNSGNVNLSAGNFVAISWNPSPGAIAYDVVCTSTNAYPTGQGTIGVAIGITQNATADTTAGSPGAAPYLTYTPMNRTYLNVAFARWDFAVDGGTIGSIIPAVSDVIPANAVILGGQIKVTAAFTGATATIAWGINGVSNTLLLAATAVATYAANAMINLAATFAAAARNTAAGQINLTIATANLTAGSAELFALYVVPTE